MVTFTSIRVGRSGPLARICRTMAAVLLAIGFVAPVFAQSFSEDINKALQSYQFAKYEDAVKQLEAFKATYGADPGFAQVSSRIDYLLVLSLVQLKQYDQVPLLVDAYEKEKA